MKSSSQQADDHVDRRDWDDCLPSASAEIEVKRSEESRRLEFTSDDFPDLTHYLFRYPAKFHPPVARTLIERYTKPDERVLDPFCGSGTLLVEALVTGRRGVGVDIDPLAILSARVKTHRYRIGQLRNESSRLFQRLDRLERPDTEYRKRQWPSEDISKEEMLEIIEAESLWVPKIPNLFHWFRKYVIIDLARILKQIKLMEVPKTHRQFFLLCFGSILRHSSNADPVPVSGLEYTSHMKEKDRKGRVINSYELLKKNLTGNLDALAAFNQHTTPQIDVKYKKANTLRLTKYTNRLRSPVDVIITSPPYHSAVNYYRRHQLEVFWLGFAETQKQRIDMKHDYIGRPKVRVTDPLVRNDENIPRGSKQWYLEMEEKSSRRARAFKHYTVAMSKVLDQFCNVLEPGKKLIMVVGHSTWNGKEIPTKDLLLEMMPDELVLSECLWYPIKNKYMSYSRHNGASIDKEYVLSLDRI